jgi:hypothetical protein
MPTLLLNTAHYNATGHLVEALKWAKGYSEQNDGLRIQLLLHAEAPLGLASACPWIERAYPVSLDQVAADTTAAACLRPIPRSWDYVVSSFRFHDLDVRKEPTAAAFCDVFEKIFEARTARGFSPGFSAFDAADKEGTQALPYRLNAPIRIPVPENARRSVERLIVPGFKISIVPSGSLGTNSPSVEGWRSICSALLEAFPEAHLYLTGISKDLVDRIAWRVARRPARRRPIIGAFSRADIARMHRGLPRVHDCFNIGLPNQLALLEASDLLVAPHMGFAFLAPCVGTPWLAVSACRWHEYLFNDVPFVSVLPDCGWYPAHEDNEDGCGRLLEEGERAICATDEHIEPNIPKIVAGAAQLRDGISFAEALRMHLKKIATADVVHERFLFFDGLGDWNQRLLVPAKTP